MKPFRPRWIPLLVLPVALVAGACGGNDADKATPQASSGLPGRLLSAVPPPGKPQAPGTYVASIPGTQAYIAVVADNGEALVYICDGDTVSQPLGGRIQGDRLELSGNGATVAAELEGQTVSGQLTLPGAGPVTFTAVPAVEGRTGLFRSTKIVDGSERVSWWVRTEEGLKGTLVSSGGKAGLDAQTAATTTGTSSSTGTDFSSVGSTGIGTTPLSERIDIIPGGSTMTCGQLKKMIDTNLAISKQAKTFQVKELYLQAALDSLAQAMINGC